MTVPPIPTGQSDQQRSRSEAPGQGEGQVVDDVTTAFAVYVLYLCAHAVGITALIGVIIAYVQRGASSGYVRSHYEFQIRTFWISILYVVIGVILLAVGIGILVFVWAFVWALIRNIKGLLILNRRQPIREPRSWAFGG